MIVDFCSNAALLSLGRDSGKLCLFAFNGEAYGVGQHGCVDPPLDEVVLGACRDCLGAGFLVVQPGENNDGGLGSFVQYGDDGPRLR